jgi:DNA-binding transcriptional LysR family regulator
MQRAALALHITQSAVSKRIAELERRLDRTLIERQGRRVSLTAEGTRIVEGGRPLLEGFRSLCHSPAHAAGGSISVEVSGSVLISWGALALAKALKVVPGLQLEIRTNHASIAVQNVRSGTSMIAIAQGQTAGAPDLSCLPLYTEQLAIVPSGLKRLTLPRQGILSVLTIEKHTEAWRYTKRALDAGARSWGFSLKSEREVQSFSAIVQMARAGFGHGLVPVEVALTLGVPKSKLLHLPSPGAAIPVSFIGRQTTLASPLVGALYQALCAEGVQGS